MRIANNLMAMNAHRQLVINQGGIAKSIEKLSSGLRINRAGDDAAGLAISEKMRGQVRGLKMAQKNALDAISLIQTAEGALQESHAILQRMRELAVQAATHTNTDADRIEIQKEINQLIEELDRIGNTTQFNTQNLLDGSFENKTFHIGANSGQNIQLTIADMRSGNIGELVETTVETTYEFTTSSDLTKTDFTDKSDSGGADDRESFTVTVNGQYYTVTLDQEYNDVAEVVDAINTQLAGSGVTAELDSNGNVVFKSVNAFTIDVTDADSFAGADNVSETENVVVVIESLADLRVDPESGAGGVLTQEDADRAISAINNAIEQVSAERSKLGAYQNRLEHTIANLGVSAENLQAAESRIRDVDMAQEMMEFTKYQILQQASTAMLAQANLAPQSVLQLLG